MYYYLKIKITRLSLLGLHFARLYKIFKLSHVKLIFILYLACIYNILLQRHGRLYRTIIVGVYNRDVRKSKHLAI